MKNLKKMGLLVGIGYVVYLVVGMMLPFVRQKKRSDSQTKNYYGSDSCVDRVSIVESSTDALAKRIQMIEHAKERIVIATFDMRKGESSSDIVAALLAAAKRNVKIKIVVDGLSGMLHMKGRALFNTLSMHPNVELRIYNKINIMRPWGFHGRMHDKYVIMDKECYLLGGRNSFDYFLGDYIEKRRSFDREVFVYNTAYKKSGNEESSLYQIEAYFNKIWDSNYVKLFRKQGWKTKRIKKEEGRLVKRYQQLRLEKPEWFMVEDGLIKGTLETKKITLISGEQHIFGKEPIVWKELKNLLMTAKEKVEMHTPYVVLDKEMQGDITEIKKKIPTFNIVLNSVTNGDNFVTSSDYIRNKKQILQTGVTLYEFEGGDSAHGKSVLIDERISVVGSYNLDLRSTYMDTELMLVIDSEEVNESLKGHLEIFCNKSRKVEDETTYLEPKEDLEILEVSFFRKISWKIVGFLLQPFRFLI